MAWNGSLTTPFPQCLAYMHNRINCVTPIWSPGLCAPGNALDLDGRKVVNTEASAVAHRCVSAEEGYANSGKYLFVFAIEEGKSEVVFGVRTQEMRYTTENTSPGFTAHGWGYHSRNGRALHNGNGKEYAEGAKSGDVIGMLLDLDVDTLSFLKNGRFLGAAHVLPAGRKFFPCVSTWAQGDSVITLSTE
mmetsp:Transcript_5945/g.14109  ORF Transcript_5945/g.14109 Transcript_5945/m.14109 type:complete len:190 (-) Transcript_5945:72-641(-)